RTLEITTRCGQDADCNPSSAGGILGVMLGWEAIPENWKSGIPTIAEKKFDYTNYSFNDIIASTMTRALKNIRLAGGRIEGDQIMIPAQTPKPPKLEQWSMGIPQKRLFTDAPDWRFDGKWPAAMDVERNRLRGHAATDPGAVATLEFTGTAIAIIGHCRQDGGRADVYLDGSKVAEIDAYIPENTHDNDLWHAYRLAPRKHTVRIVTRPDADPRSAGHLVMIESAVTFSR
ncbi:ADP-ribosylglycohydrolase family protein, partial [Candidatus Sumerlaeota bacterium]|nr:ADP-ribosylglycohydrolase family protein [Candidatus Sumerlaeota bacterium]